jgi:hypothetical protein
VEDRRVKCVGNSIFDVHFFREEMKYKMFGTEWWQAFPNFVIVISSKL